MKYVLSGKFRDTGKQIVRVIDAPSKDAAMQIAMDQGMSIESVGDYVAPPAEPTPQRVQIVAGVWTIALGVVLGNAVIVGVLILLGLVLGYFDALFRSLSR